MAPGRTRGWVKGGGGASGQLMSRVMAPRNPQDTGGTAQPPREGPPWKPSRAPRPPCPPLLLQCPQLPPPNPCCFSGASSTSAQPWQPVSSWGPWPWLSARGLGVRGCPERGLLGCLMNAWILQQRQGGPSGRTATRWLPGHRVGTCQSPRVLGHTCVLLSARPGLAPNVSGFGLLQQQWENDRFRLWDSTPHFLKDADLPWVCDDPDKSPPRPAPHIW